MTFLRKHALVIGAALVAALFVLAGRVSRDAAARAVDVDLLLVLFALLVTVEILRASGWLDLAVAATMTRFHRTRSFAAALIVFTGALAALVTNDVALFVVIPFTVVASRFSDFDLEDAVVLEVIASNLLGCLTPLGNPQNLFVFHQSGWSAGRFVLTMLPFVALSALGLALALPLLGRSRPMTKTEVTLPPRNNPAALAGLLCFALVLLEIARVLPAWPSAVAALIAGAFFLRQRFFTTDLSIVPLFFFAFIIVAGLRTFGALRWDVYWTSVGLSQVISNVPATVLLAPFAGEDWRTLLYGVNAGGCGTIIASLANLLGWRIYVRESGRDPRFFRRLTIINFAFLAWIATGGFALLYFGV